MSDNVVEITLSQGELSALKQCGDVPQVIEAAVTAYLKRTARPLPVMNFAGRPARDTGTSIVWSIPERLKSAFRPDVNGLTHVRAAIREYLRFFGVPMAAPAPVPVPVELEVVNIVIQEDAVTRLRSLKGTLGGHVEAAVREFYPIGRGKSVSSSVYDYTSGSEVFTELEWQASPELVQMLPLGYRDRSEYIRAAIGRYLSHHEGHRRP